MITNTGRLGRYKTVEASITKRYAQQVVGVGRRQLHLRDDFPTDTFPQTPNHPGRYDRTTWDFKATGSYDAPWGMRLSPVLRHQSGSNFAREISVPASAATPFGLIIPAHDHLRRCGGRQPPGQHLGVRLPRREDVQPDRAACGSAASSTCSTSRTAARRRPSPAPPARTTCGRRPSWRRAPHASASASSSKREGRTQRPRRAAGAALLYPGSCRRPGISGAY